MTKEQVVEIMKKPDECIKIADEEVLIWDGACVSLVNNQVVDMTPLDTDNANYYKEKLADVNSRSTELVDEIFGATDRSPSNVGPYLVPTP